MNPNILPDYNNRWTRDQNWDRVLFRAGRTAQSAEVNEVQDILRDRMDTTFQYVYQNGQVMHGSEAVVLTPTEDLPETLQIESGNIFVKGAVYDVEGESLTIPLDTKVTVGLRLRFLVITEDENPSLVNPAINTKGYNDAGAARYKSEVRWGWISEDGTERDTYTEEDWEFHPVYDIDNGVIILKTNPLIPNPIMEMIARYDREAHGSYVTGGFKLRYNRTADGKYYYDIEKGTANINGFKVERAGASSLSFTIDPDPQSINNEPHTFTPDIDGRGQVFVNRSPIATVGEIIAHVETTEDVVHGGFAGAVDALANESVESITSIHYGEDEDRIDYVQGTDFLLVDGNVDWSPAGAEPPTGATYVVVYRHLVTPEPEDYEQGLDYFIFTGFVPGSSVIIDYTYKLPRVDALVLDRDGTIERVKGIPQLRNPEVPQVSSNQIILATIYYDWVNEPFVRNIAVRAIQFAALETLRETVLNLIDLVSLERLRNDVSLSDQTSKYGVFVDGFVGDKLRDFGIEQGASVRDETLNLPIRDDVVLTGSNAANVAAPHFLDFTLETVIEQPNITRCRRINPYQNFDPTPAKVKLTPNVDHYIEYRDTIVRDIATSFSIGRHGPNEVGVQLNILTQSTEVLAYMRTIEVRFDIEGFLPTEELSLTTFGDVIFTPVALPAGTLITDADGKLSGKFTIPASTPAGTRIARFEGEGGSVGWATFVGDQSIVSRTLERETVTIIGDPLAQTFTLPESRMLKSLEVKFCAKGTSGAPVIVQVRGTTVGLPNSEVFGETYLPASAILLDSWTTITFDRPIFVEGGQEYCLVFLTNDGLHALSTAALGDIVQPGNGPNAPFYITRQPYSIGVMLTSSNNVTWTPHQEEDLSFRLNCCVFSPLTKTVAFGTIAVTNMTDFMTLATVGRYSPATDVVFSMTEAGTGTIHRGGENELLQLNSRITDTITQSAALVGTRNISPIIFENTQFLKANIADNEIYVSRAFKAALDFDTRLIIETRKPGSASVIPYVAVQRMSGMTEVEVDGVYQFDWVALELTNREPVGDGWFQDTWLIETQKGVDPSERLTRIKLVLSGGPANRPAARRLRGFTF